MLKQKKKCIECGKELSKRATTEFCSQVCKSINNGTRIKYKCDYCGKESTDKKSHYDKKKNHYCSVECKSKHQGLLYSGENNSNFKSVKTECTNCGKSILVAAQLFEKGKKRFCDVKCRDEYIDSNHRIYIKCDYCGKEVSQSKSQYNNSKTHCCSVECKDKLHSVLMSGSNNIRYNKELFYCEVCGKETYKTPCEIKRNNHIYCSSECRYIGFGINYSGENNSKWKDKVEFMCDYCGKESIMPEKQFYKFNKHYCSKECQISDYKNPLRPLCDYIRSNSIWEWYDWSKKKYKYQCIVTGSKDFVVHHLYKFEYIIKETISILGYETYETIGEYTESQLREIERVCLELHFKYGEGVLLSKEIHTKLHMKPSNGGLGNGRKCNKENFIAWIKKQYGITIDI